MTDPSVSPWPGKLGAVEDVMAVSRAFGESYVMDDRPLSLSLQSGGGGGGRDAGSPAGARRVGLRDRGSQLRTTWDDRGCPHP